MAKAKRKGLSKKVRFEVFKRDSFTCQYCGKAAPDVVLECDHISPVSKGGKNDLLNLITSCRDCNAGKSNRELSDDSAIQKQKAQLAELNERREQLEMMLKWREGMKSITEDYAEAVSDAWSEATNSQWRLSETGIKDTKALIRKYGLKVVLEAVDIAAERYIKWKDDEADRESVRVAMNKVSGVCYGLTQPKEIRDLFYIRGIVRNRMYCKEYECLNLLRRAHELGADVEELKEIAKHESNWTNWQLAMYELIEGLGGANG